MLSILTFSYVANQLYSLYQPNISEDQVAANLKREAELCHTALLGYGKGDLLDIRPIWRMWNKRALVPAEASKILDSFRKHGIRRYAPSNLIPLIVPREWVDAKHLKLNPATGANDLPDIVWTSQADKRRIYGASGQHRYEALRMHQEDLSKKLERTRKEAEALLARQKLKKDVGDEEISEVQTRVQRLTALVSGDGMWGFAIYDYGMRLIYITITFDNLIIIRQGTVR